MTYTMRTIVAAIALLASSFGAFPPAAAAPEVLIDCGDKTAGRDDYDRGFYIPQSPGLFLDSVSLWMGGEAAERTITLYAHAGTFDGPVIEKIGTTVNLTPANQEVVFDFGHIVVPQRAPIAFRITVDGNVPDHLVGVSTGGYLAEPSDCIVIQTDGTNPPLSDFRRPGLAITVTGEPAAATVVLPMLATADAGD